MGGQRGRRSPTLRGGLRPRPGVRSLPRDSGLALPAAPLSQRGHPGSPAAAGPGHPACRGSWAPLRRTGVSAGPCPPPGLPAGPRAAPSGLPRPPGSAASPLRRGALAPRTLSSLPVHDVLFHFCACTHLSAPTEKHHKSSNTRQRKTSDFTSVPSHRQELRCHWLAGC